MSFNDLNLDPSILKMLDTVNFKDAYPVQQEAIPAILTGEDVMIISKTGSGKTACFLIPILQELLQVSTDRDRNIHTLILAPTRELASQIGDLLYNLCHLLEKKIKSYAVYGGVSINPQMKALYGVDILVATPGRLLDLIDNNAISLARVKTLVVDEADRLLNMGFKEEMKDIFSQLPTKRQNILISATLSEDLTSLENVLLNNPKVIRMEADPDKLDQIEQIAYRVLQEKKGPLLRYIIRNHSARSILVFSSSVDKADKMVNKLHKNGIDARAIHSKKSQGARSSAIEDFKKGTLRVLVATDLLSRGIDIEELPLVINYELPRSPKDYIHRIGRTGRADKKGEAISLISQEEESHFRTIQKKMGKWVTQQSSDHIDLHGY